MNYFAIFFGIYLICAIFALIMIVLLVQEVMRVADFFKKGIPVPTDFQIKKGRRLVWFLVLTPVLNLIVGIIAFSIKPDNLYLALDERGVFVPR